MAQNKQSERSKQWLEEALLSLMQKKHFQDITVTDITEKAGVSRLTFYRNFESKEDVLLRYFDRLFQSYLQEVQNDSSCTLHHALCKCFEYWQCHAKESGLLIRDDLAMLLYKPYGQYLDQVLENVSMPFLLSPTQKRFVVGGLYFSMLHWLEAGCSQTPGEMAAEILELVGLAE